MVVTPTEKPKVYLDTNVLADYFWAEFRIQKARATGIQANLPKKLESAHTLFKRCAELGEFELTLTNWSFWELNDIIRRQLFLHKCISYGYQIPQEQQKAMKEISPLDNEELDTFKQLAASLYSAVGTKSSIYGLDVGEIDAMKYSGLETFDAILFFQAVSNNCDFFVTRDEEFIEKGRKYCQTTGCGIELKTLDEFFHYLDSCQTT